jgi:hypothetical protein
MSPLIRRDSRTCHSATNGPIRNFRQPRPFRSISRSSNAPKTSGEERNHKTHASVSHPVFGFISNSQRHLRVTLLLDLLSAQCQFCTFDCSGALLEARNHHRFRGGGGYSGRTIQDSDFDGSFELGAAVHDPVEITDFGAFATFQRKGLRIHLPRLRPS